MSKINSNKLKISSIAILILSISLFQNCDIVNNDAKPKDEFVKIIHEADYNTKVYPVDILQTADSSFLILSAVYNNDNSYVWHTPQISKTDASGKVLWQQKLESPYVNPVGKILDISGEYYFVCMNENTLSTYIMKINKETGETTVSATLDDIKYPLYSYVSSNNSVLIQGYNHFARKTIFAKLSSSFSVTFKKEYYLYEDAEEMILSHITKTGKQFPLKIGELSDGNYYINGFYNYTFSTLFIDKDSGNITGVVNGFRYEAGISSFIETSAGTFALSIFNQNDNYFITNKEISTSATSSVENLKGDYISDLQQNAHVVGKLIKTSSEDMFVFASSTKSNEIVLYFYDKANGKLLYTKHISDSNPVEIQSLIQTDNKSIVVLAKTFVNGRFPRIFIAKTELDFD